MFCVTPGCRKNIEVMELFRCQKCADGFNKEWEEIKESFTKPRMEMFEKDRESVMRAVALLTSLYPDGSFLTMKVLFEKVYLDLTLKNQRIAFLENKMSEARQIIASYQKVNNAENKEVPRPSRPADKAKSNVVELSKETKSKAKAKSKKK